MERISLNGEFIVCEKDEAADSQIGSFTVHNKEEVPRFKIVEKHLKAESDFPFEVGDTVCSASTGTIVNYKGKKIWLFQPERILAKIF